jgi:hypothetical protein
VSGVAVLTKFISGRYNDDVADTGELLWCPDGYWILPAVQAELLKPPISKAELSLRQNLQIRDTLDSIHTMGRRDVTY